MRRPIPRATNSAAEQEADDASSFGGGASEQDGADRDEGEGENDDADPIRPHAAPYATVSTRQGACLRM